VDIGLELAFLLEPRLGMRVERRVLVVFHLVVIIIPCSKPGLARGLLLCKLLLERPLLLGRG